MSLRGYARHRGCSLKAVQKAIAAGRITKTPDGKIDSDVADQQWAANTDSAAANRDYAKGAGRAQRSRTSPSTEGAPPAADPNASAVNYAQARAVREAYTARLARLKFEEESGRLVPVDELERRLTNVISTSRTKVLAVPSKVRSRLPHLTNRDIAVIDELIREALEELANVGAG